MLWFANMNCVAPTAGRIVKYSAASLSACNLGQFKVDLKTSTQAKPILVFRIHSSFSKCITNVLNGGQMHFLNTVYKIQRNKNLAKQSFTVVRQWTDVMLSTAYMH